VQNSSKDVLGRLETEGKDLKGHVEGLEKKFHYLETTNTNAKDNFQRLLRSAGGA
jgi:hypothetical protein